MRHTLRLRVRAVCAVILLSTASLTLAESPFVGELETLKSQRDKAIATATDPINRRYQEALEAMLRKATQASDLDAAIVIKVEIASLAKPTDGKIDVSIQKVLKALPGQWTWETPQNKNWGTFDEDGRTYRMGPVIVAYQVKVSAGGGVTLTHPGTKKKATLQLSADLKSYTGTTAEGEPVSGSRRK